MKTKLISAVAVCCLVVSGCLGVAGPGTSTETSSPPSTTVTPMPTQTATEAMTSGVSPTPTTSCTVDPIQYDVSVPDRPTSLNESSALRVATEFERAYTKADIRAFHDNVTITSLGVDNRPVESIADGYRVTVRPAYAFQFGDDGHGSGGYESTYRITDRKLVMDNETIACWD